MSAGSASRRTSSSAAIVSSSRWRGSNDGRLDLLVAGAERSAPRVDPAEQDGAVVVAEVAEQPPQPLGAAERAVRDDEHAGTDAGPRCGSREPLRRRQRVPPQPGNRQIRQIVVDVEIRRPGNVAGEVQLPSARGRVQLPPAVDELEPHGSRLRQVTAPLEEQHVTPRAVHLADPLAHADDPEAADEMQPDAGAVLRKDPRLRSSRCRPRPRGRAAPRAARARRRARAPPRRRRRCSRRRRGSSGAPRPGVSVAQPATSPSSSATRRMLRDERRPTPPSSARPSRTSRCRCGSRPRRSRRPAANRPAAGPARRW